MPQIDVSAALTNPLTLDVFDVFRRITKQNSYGEGEVILTLVPKVYGVVYATPDSGLRRTDDRSEQAKHITIITRFALRGVAKQASTEQFFQPDLILWNRNMYLVESLDDYSQWGSGFNSVNCTILDFSAEPIQMPAPINLRRTFVHVTVTIIDATHFTVPLDVVPESTLVFKNGELVDPEDYSWTGNSCTLNQPLDLESSTPDNVNVYMS